MSKSVSFRDLLKFPALSGLKEIELIFPVCDAILRPYVHMLGIDTTQPVEYCANIHRDLSNKADIGFRVVGEQRMDPAYTHSPMADQIERIIATGQNDISLMQELVEMMNRTVNFKAFHGPDADDSDSIEFPAELIDEDYKKNSDAIAVMNNLIIEVRGSNIVTYPQ